MKVSGPRCQRPVLREERPPHLSKLRGPRTGFRSASLAGDPSTLLPRRSSLFLALRSSPALRKRPMRSEACLFCRDRLIRKPLIVRTIGGSGRSRLPRREKRLINDGMLGRASFPPPGSHAGPRVFRAWTGKSCVLSSENIFKCCEEAECGRFTIFD